MFLKKPPCSVLILSFNFLIKEVSSSQVTCSVMQTTNTMNVDIDNFVGSGIFLFICIYAIRIYYCWLFIAINIHLNHFMFSWNYFIQMMLSVLLHSFKSDYMLWTINTNIQCSQSNCCCCGNSKAVLFQAFSVISQICIDC